MITYDPVIFFTKYLVYLNVKQFVVFMLAILASKEHTVALQE
jgi:hypothetical protein